MVTDTQTTLTENTIENTDTHHGNTARRVRTRKNQNKHHILILNAKGGSGKSTIASNLCSYLVNQERKAALLDFDPQASCSHWLKLRSDSMPEIYGIQAYKKAEVGKTRSQQLTPPSDVSMLVYDTPGSLDGLELDRLIERSQTILIPVQPSPIDIHAATRFIQKVLLNPYFRRSEKRIAVIANRARANTNAYGKLRLFLNRLTIPLVTTIRDTQNYVKAFESGKGIIEISGKNKKDEESWQALLEWIDQYKP